jgi:hypothetical protein
MYLLIIKATVLSSLTRLCASSSVVERDAVAVLVAGSIPAWHHRGNLVRIRATIEGTLYGFSVADAERFNSFLPPSCTVFRPGRNHGEPATDFLVICP